MTAEQQREVATEMTLAALRAAVDGTSFRLLARLRSADASLEELMAEACLGRLATQERVAALAAAALVTRDPRSGRIAATRLALGCIGLVERVRDRFAEKIAARLPALEREGR